MDRSVHIPERAAHAHSVATAKGRQVGRPVLADPDKAARRDRDLSRTLPCSSAGILAAHRTGRRARGDVEVGAVLAADQVLARIED